MMFFLLGGVRAHAKSGLLSVKGRACLLNTAAVLSVGVNPWSSHTHTHTHSMTYSAFIHSNTLHLLFIPFFHTPTHTKAAQSHNSGACGQGCVQYKGTLMTWPIEYGQREKEKKRGGQVKGRMESVWSQGHRWRAERAEKMCVYVCEWGCVGGVNGTNDSN